MARLSSGEGLALLKRPLKFKRGDKGPFIVDIQAMFAKLGFDPGEPEGVFMAKTEDAVRVFQAEYGLPVTGIIDAKTLKFLYEEADPEGYPAVLIEGEETGDSNEIAKDEETAAGEKAIAGEESKSADGLMDEQGLAENQEFISAQGLTGNHGLIEGHEPADDKGGADDQDLVDHLGSVEGQGSSPDKEIAGDEPPVATPAEVRPDMTTMATGASDHAIVISLSDRALGLYQGNQLIRRGFTLSASYAILMMTTNIDFTTGFVASSSKR
jgi:peptidoglycan hydrolase-like protein with peptidoglycan-binding domain